MRFGTDMETVTITTSYQNKSGLILLDPVAERIVVGTAHADFSAMTGTWFVYGQKGDENRPYLTREDKRAAQLCLTVDHWNRTGERKKFKSIKLVRVRERRAARTS